MCHFCYIIYSKSLDRFYVGETSDFEQRLLFHNIGFSGFTSKASDWEPFLVIECKDKLTACKMKKHIKSMRSVNYIKDHVAHPEKLEKLKSK
jgi:putative endonuclease